ncbi:MAG: alcohol dehydrogenase catalytic domain-containing protein, partial [Actinomycetota bacterium]
MTTMRAFTAGHDDTGYTRGVVDFPIEQLGDGDVVVRVHYSGINFKDGLAGSEKGKVARLDPIIPGIDLAGEVVESSDPSVAVGSLVIAHGYDIGVSHHGGYAELAHVKPEWVVPLPHGLDPRTA